MKKLLLAAFIATLTLGLASCDKGGDSFSSDDIVGEWRVVYAYYYEKENGRIVNEDEGSIPRSESFIMTFSEDGYYSMEYDGDVEEEGTWRLSGKTLRLTYEYDGDDESYDLTVERLTSDELVLSENDHYVEDGITHDDYYRMTLERID